MIPLMDVIIYTCSATRTLTQFSEFVVGIRGGSRICGKGGGGAAATASAAGAKVFGESRLKTLFGISKGGRAPPAAPPP